MNGGRAAICTPSTTAYKAKAALRHAQSFYMAKKHGRTLEQIHQLVGHGGIPIVNALNGETDRGCALVAAEFLSDVLEVYFRGIMTRRGAEEKAIQEFLVTVNAPLGNLSPRTKAAFWFGLIGPKTFEALEHVREIRNRCAHRAGPIALSDNELESRVRALESYVNEIVETRTNQGVLHERYFGESSEFYGHLKHSPQRRTFMTTVYELHCSIHFCSLIAESHGLPLEPLKARGGWW